MMENSIKFAGTLALVAALAACGSSKNADEAAGPANENVEVAPSLPTATTDDTKLAPKEGQSVENGQSTAATTEKPQVATTPRKATPPQKKAMVKPVPEKKAEVPAEPDPHAGHDMSDMK